MLDEIIEWETNRLLEHLSQVELPPELEDPKLVEDMWEFILYHIGE